MCVLSSNPSRLSRRRFAASSGKVCRKSSIATLARNDPFCADRRVLARASSRSTVLREMAGVTRSRQSARANSTIPKPDATASRTPPKRPAQRKIDRQTVQRGPPAWDLAEEQQNESQAGDNENREIEENGELPTRAAMGRLATAFSVLFVISPLVGKRKGHIGNNGCEESVATWRAESGGVRLINRLSDQSSRCGTGCDATNAVVANLTAGDTQRGIATQLLIVVGEAHVDSL